MRRRIKAMKSNISVFYGIGLILIGIILLIPQIFGTGWDADKLSLLAISILGVFMFISYFISEKKPFALILFGTLFFFLGLIFLYSLVNGWSVWKYIAPSPLFILAISFYMTYLIDKRHPSGFFVAAIILGIVSLCILIILSIIFNETMFTSIALIISGSLLPFASLIKKKKDQPAPGKTIASEKTSPARSRSVKK
jgi:hypothetical protein